MDIKKVFKNGFFCLRPVKSKIDYFRSICKKQAPTQEAFDERLELARLALAAKNSELSTVALREVVNAMIDRSGDSGSFVTGFDVFLDCLRSDDLETRDAAHKNFALYMNAFRTLEYSEEEKNCLKLTAFAEVISNAVRSETPWAGCALTQSLGSDALSLPLQNACIDMVLQMYQAGSVKEQAPILKVLSWLGAERNPDKCEETFLLAQQTFVSEETSGLDKAVAQQSMRNIARSHPDHYGILIERAWKAMDSSEPVVAEGGFMMLLDAVKRASGQTRATARDSLCEAVASSNQKALSPISLNELFSSSVLKAEEKILEAALMRASEIFYTPQSAEEDRTLAGKFLLDISVKKPHAITSTIANKVMTVASECPNEDNSKLAFRILDSMAAHAPDVFKERAEDSMTYYLYNNGGRPVLPARATAMKGVWARLHARRHANP